MQIVQLNGGRIRAERGDSVCIEGPIQQQVQRLVLAPFAIVLCFAGLIMD